MNYKLDRVAGIYTSISKVTGTEGYSEKVVECVFPSDETMNSWTKAQEKVWIKENNEIMSKMFESLVNTPSTHQLTINSKVYLVSRDYAFKKKFGGIILVGKVKTFRNVRGEIEPIFCLPGKSGVEYGLKEYVPFVDIQKAIEAIKS